MKNIKIFQSLPLFFQKNLTNIELAERLALDAAKEGNWETIEYLHEHWYIKNFKEIIYIAMDDDRSQPKTHHEYVWIIGSCVDWIYDETIFYDDDEWRDLLLDLSEEGYDGVP